MLAVGRPCYINLAHFGGWVEDECVSIFLCDSAV